MELGSVTLKRIVFFCFPIKHSTHMGSKHVFCVSNVFCVSTATRTHASTHFVRGHRHPHMPHQKARETLLLLQTRHSQTFTSTQAWENAGDLQWVQDTWCEGERHHTKCIQQKTNARLLPLESPARGCSGSKYSSAQGPIFQGRSSRAPSPACPIVDLDHALPFSPHCSTGVATLKHYLKNHG
jgi:hypothetical protein